MRDLSHEEALLVSKAASHLGSKDIKIALKKAESAARNQMKRMSRNLVNGMSSEDFAVEAFLYISSRGQNISYITRRSKLLVIDNHRNESGRHTSKNRARYTGNFSETSYIRSKDAPSRWEIPSEIPQSIKMLFEGLLTGQSKKAIARRLGMHPSTLSHLIKDNKELIEKILT